MDTLSEHGLCPQEEAIMDLWDEGLSVDEIAADLGLSWGSVNRAVNSYAEGGSDRWHLAVPTATQKLLAAIARAHPDRVAA